MQIDGQLISDRLLSAMRDRAIDVDLTLRILRQWNDGEGGRASSLKGASIPSSDDPAIIDRSRGRAPTLRVDAEIARARLTELAPEIDFDRWIDLRSGGVILGDDDLRRIGVLLYPRVAYGLLNGGSATSFVDRKRNQALSAGLFERVADDWHRLAELCAGRAKGICPAFLHPDGQPGVGHLELKMRGLLIEALRYRLLRGAEPDRQLQPLFPLFQMTSIHTDGQIADAYREYRSGATLSALIDRVGLDITAVETGLQPLIAAYTHSELGEPRRIFDRAWGRHDEPLALAGGHGQNFQALMAIYRSLAASGKRFVYLGNVDNVGYRVDPIAIAWLALSGKQALFEFAFRTPIDVKGGILVRGSGGRLVCGDIGPVIQFDEVLANERAGRPILFNCATGLFDLRWLVGHLDSIIDRLPLRLGDQDKDAGRYSQAEQITWEVLGLLDDIVIFAVDKHKRFLAAKLLMETLLTSGVSLQPIDVETSPLLSTARDLHDGLRHLLGRYGYRLEGNRWQPLGVEQLERSL